MKEIHIIEKPKATCEIGPLHQSASVAAIEELCDGKNVIEKKISTTIVDPTSVAELVKDESESIIENLNKSPSELAWQLSKVETLTEKDDKDDKFSDKFIDKEPEVIEIHVVEPVKSAWGSRGSTSGWNFPSVVDPVIEPLDTVESVIGGLDTIVEPDNFVTIAEPDSFVPIAEPDGFVEIEEPDIFDEPDLFDKPDLFDEIEADNEPVLDDFDDDFGYPIGGSSFSSSDDLLSDSDWPGVGVGLEDDDFGIDTGIGFDSGYGSGFGSDFGSDFDTGFGSGSGFGGLSGGLGYGSDSYFGW